MVQFINGLCVVCTEPPEPSMVKHASCYMQLELLLANDLLPQLRSEYTIPGEIEVRGTRVICWRPTSNARELLLNQLSNMVLGNEDILARFTIRGSHIHQLDEPEIYLDGEVTSTLDGAQPHNLNLPSGDGKRGGDFEVWFNVQQVGDEPDPPGPRPISVIHWAVDGLPFPDSLDPILVTEPQDITAIHLLFGGLVRLGENGMLLPDLAEEWEVSEDGLTYTIFLRDGLQFSDGSPLFASDVQFSLDRARDPANSATGPIYLSAIQEVEVVDDLTVSIQLNAPSRVFVLQLTTAPAKIISEAALDAGAITEITSGAFFLQERNEPVLVMAQNPQYWQPAGVESIELVYVESYEIAAMLYESGEADVAGSIQTGLPPRASDLDGFEFVDESCAVRYINFIRNQDSEFDFFDPRFSQAISHALNRDALVNFIEQAAASASRLLPPCIERIPDPDSSVLDFDPELANQLLEEIGYIDQDGDGIRDTQDGIPLQFTLLYADEGNSVNHTVVDLIRTDLLQIGIVIDPQVVGIRELSEQLHLVALNPNHATEANWHLYYSIWTADYLDAQNLLSQQLHSIRGPRDRNNNGHFEDGDFDGFVEAGDERQTGFEQLYRSAELLALENGGWIPLFHPRPAALVRSDEERTIEGIILTGRGLIVPEFEQLRINEST